MIAFDIETGKADNYKDFMPEFIPPKDGRSKSLEKQQEEWESKLALSPLTGKILAIGIMFNSDGDDYEIATFPEKENIKLFWDNYEYYIQKTEFFVGHNIKKFDLPFIIRRGLLYDIKPPIDLIRDKYNLPFFADTMEIWSQGIYGKEEYTSLDSLAKYFGVGKKTGKGADFEKLFLNPDTKQDAIDYLKNDLLITYKVAEKLL